MTSIESSCVSGFSKVIKDVVLPEVVRYINVRNVPTQVTVEELYSQCLKLPYIPHNNQSVNSSCLVNASLPSLNMSGVLEKQTATRAKKVEVKAETDDEKCNYIFKRGNDKKGTRCDLKITPKDPDGWGCEKHYNTETGKKCKNALREAGGIKNATGYATNFNMPNMSGSNSYVPGDNMNVNKVRNVMNLELFTKIKEDSIYIERTTNFIFRYFGSDKYICLGHFNRERNSVEKLTSPQQVSLAERNLSYLDPDETNIIADYENEIDVKRSAQGMLNPGFPFGPGQFQPIIIGTHVNNSNMSGGLPMYGASSSLNSLPITNSLPSSNSLPITNSLPSSNPLPLKTNSLPSSNPLPLNTVNSLPSSNPLPMNTVNSLPSSNSLPMNTVNNLPSSNSLPMNTVNSLPSSNPLPMNTVNNLPSSNSLPMNTVNSLPSSNSLPMNTVNNLTPSNPLPMNTVNSLSSSNSLPMNTVNNLPPSNSLPMNTVNSLPSSNSLPMNTVNNLPSSNSLPMNTVNSLPSSNPLPMNTVNSLPSSNALPVINNNQPSNQLPVTNSLPSSNLSTTYNIPPVSNNSNNPPTVNKSPSPSLNIPPVSNNSPSGVLPTTNASHLTNSPTAKQGNVIVSTMSSSGKVTPTIKSSRDGSDPITKYGKYDEPFDDDGDEDDDDDY